MEQINLPTGRFEASNSHPYRAELPRGERVPIRWLPGRPNQPEKVL